MTTAKKTTAMLDAEIAQLRTALNGVSRDLDKLTASAVTTAQTLAHQAEEIDKLRKMVFARTGGNKAKPNTGKLASPDGLAFCGVCKHRHAISEIRNNTGHYDPEAEMAKLGG